MCGQGTLTYEVSKPKEPIKRVLKRFFSSEETPGDLGYNDYIGTFLNDKFHGFGKQTWPHFTYEGAYKDGKRHGRSTVY